MEKAVTVFPLSATSKHASVATGFASGICGSSMVCGGLEKGNRRGTRGQCLAGRGFGKTGASSEISASMDDGRSWDTISWGDGRAGGGGRVGVTRGSAKCDM